MRAKSGRGDEKGDHGSCLLLLQMDWSAAGREGWKQANHGTSIERPRRIGLPLRLNEPDLMIRKKEFRGLENMSKDKREEQEERWINRNNSKSKKKGKRT